MKRERMGKSLYPHSGSGFAGCGQSLSASAAYLGKLSAWSTVRAAGTEEEDKKKSRFSRCYHLQWFNTRTSCMHPHTHLHHLHSPPPPTHIHPSHAPTPEHTPLTHPHNPPPPILTHHIALPSTHPHTPITHQCTHTQPHTCNPNPHTHTHPPHTHIHHTHATLPHPHTHARALHISAHLSTNAVSALWKVWVQIRLWKQYSIEACTSTLGASAPANFVPSRIKRSGFYLCWMQAATKEIRNLSVTDLLPFEHQQRLWQT